MTGKDLKDNGWIPQLCRIGTLYFKDRFFCRIKDDGNVLLFSVKDDMNPLGTASTIEGMNEIEKRHYMDEIARAESVVEILKNRYRSRFGEL